VAALARISAIDVVTPRSGTAARERPSRRRERAWIKAAQAGSDEAMEALFRVHWGPAHRAAFLVVHDAAAAEDIAQEAFLSAIRALDRFDRRRPFGPWLHRIVVNRAIDWSRARTLRREVAEPMESEAPEERPEGWSEEVLAALSVLDADQRAAVVLRHLLEYTPGEIADMLELPRGTVNSRLRRALDRLAAELGEERS
jgi:RNA polymerase sigma-70 factor, ECF subfamily